MNVDELIQGEAFALLQPDKERVLTSALNELTALHIARCGAYARLLRVFGQTNGGQGTMANVPWLPVGLFKSHELVSVPRNEVFKTLTSSGTTDQQVSRVFLDRETARRQSQALACIMRSILGSQRLPMLIVDCRNLISDRTSYSARGAGVLGMTTFGRDHCYILDDRMELDRDALRAFLAKHGRSPFLVFGFTFLVWEHLLAAGRDGMDLSNGTLVHSGGWKKLTEQAVTNASFKERLKVAVGLQRVYNFYGMVEQVGSVFLEGDDGFLYAPSFADVIVRDPLTWLPAPTGTPGVVQVVSALPTSYPGHSILTEDLGVVHGIDDSPERRGGKRFSILGRLPRAELRGCSDTTVSRSAA